MKAIYCAGLLGICVTVILSARGLAQERAAIGTPQETAPVQEAAAEQPPQGDPANDAAETGTPGPCEGATETEPDSLGVRARFQLSVSSVHGLRDAVQRSPLGPLVKYASDAATENLSRSSDWIDMEQLSALRDWLAHWPDTKAELAIFAPDLQGRARWAVRVALPVGEVHDLARDLLEHERFEEFFQGSQIQIDQQRFMVEVNDQPVVFLQAAGTASTVISSHADLSLPAEFFDGSQGDSRALVAARLTFANTEKDSGETFFSKLKLIKSLDYALQNGDDGNWEGELSVAWPPVVGLAAKPFVGRTRQTFFVPQMAFSAIVMKITSTSAALDKLVGLDDKHGPLQDHARDELCVSILPGNGFFPVPDVVLQCRATDAEQLNESVRRHVVEANQKAQQREARTPWHITKVRDHDVFWSDQSLEGQTLIPFTMRPVLFVQEAKDAKDRSRNFLVIGFTSTDPEEFVSRWLDLPRGHEARYLPSQASLNGEAWVNWNQVVDWLIPYFNLGLSGASSDFVIHDDLADGLSESQLTVKLNYQGLKIKHTGPLPLGVLTLPAMISASMQEASGSDLARERIAVRRLQVLHHHSRLFYQDLGRWPVEVAELDGYIDFAGNAYLLKLRGSPKKRIAEFFEQLFDSKQKDGNKKNDDEASEEEDLYAEIDDSLYVIAWRDDTWTLGFKAGQLDHLEQLYIDQQGLIHRVPKAVKERANQILTDADTERDDARDPAPRKGANAAAPDTPDRDN